MSDAAGRDALRNVAPATSYTETKRCHQGATGPNLSQSLALKAPLVHAKAFKDSIALPFPTSARDGPTPFVSASLGYLRHYVHAYLGDKARIAIAANASVRVTGPPRRA